MENNIKVALRIRPQQPKERIEGCDVCTRVCPDAPQVFIGKEKAFTFDYVYDINSNQEEIYCECVDNLVEGCFDGYNATVLAYGQTGSGKTFTMGTGLELIGNPQTKGIIPRAVDHLFNGISQRQEEARKKGQPVPDFHVTAQFLELYNEDVIDLLSANKTNHEEIKIREDKSGSMYVVGASSHQVRSVEETSQILKTGALSRTTGSTQMNSQSSRSHAIFTLMVKQTRVVPIDDVSGQQEFESLTAKFHFVDLAGSERLKRTGATGDRAKEGIAINSGLLVLGNVISALGDKTKKTSHVPYRDSKLTRFLQDSLGGNSRTLMIACISPSDRDFVETLNTLRYANRAKNITNRIQVNQDKSSQVISALRRQIADLELELMEYKQGKRLITEDGSEAVNDMFHENTMLQNEVTRLKTRVKVLEEATATLNQTVIQLKTERDTNVWTSATGGAAKDVSELVSKYLTEVEELRSKLIESEETASELRRQISKIKSPGKGFLSPFSAVAISGHYDVISGGNDEEMDADQLIKIAKQECKILRKKAKRELKFNGQELPHDSTINHQQDPNGNDVPSLRVNGETGPVHAISDGDDRTSPEESLTEDEEELEDEDEDDDADTASTTQTQLELYNLTSEITTKERLIAELERSQKKLAHLQKQYEDKLIQLQQQIQEVQKDRDQALSKLSQSSGSAAENKKKKVQEDYQVKLNALEDQVKKYQAAKLEHDKSMRQNAQKEQQMRKLKNEVEDMKKTKVRLMAIMKEEQQKRREEGAKYNKKIAQMSKNDRLKDVKIRALESEKKKTEAMLRRKDEEVKHLKSRVKPMSDLVAGRAGSLVNLKKGLNGTNGVSNMSSNSRNGIAPRNQPKPQQPFNARSAKVHWNQMEKHINSIVIWKKMLAHHENQMERYLLERKAVTQAISRDQRRLDQYRREKRPALITQQLSDEIESNSEKLSYVVQNINDCRDAIIQLEQNLHEAEDLAPVVSTCTHPQEMEYIIKKCMEMVITQSLEVAAKEDEKNVKDIIYQDLNRSFTNQAEILNHVLEVTNPMSPGGSVRDEPIERPHHQTMSNGHSARNNHALPPPHPYTSSWRQQSSTSNTSNNQTSVNNVRYSPHIPRRNINATQQQGVHHFAQPSMSCPAGNDDDFEPYSCSPTKRDKRKGTMTASELYNDVSNPFNNAILLEKSDESMTKSLSLNHASVMTDLHRVPSAPFLKDLLPDTTPPASPSMMRKNRDENVFSRLTSGTTTSSIVQPDRGMIAPFTAKAQYDKGSPLICTHIAEGHSRAVLSVSATNDVLFTGSKDCTVKIWDLHTGREIQSLVDHPDSVTIVRYNEYNRLAFSVSKSYIKVWDPRENPGRCVKTLSSSGLASSGISHSQSTGKSNELAHGETRIFDIRLSPYGSTLFSTAGQIVRFWDLRMFFCVGKLNTGHQSNITCMAVEESGVDNNLVVTGSKDHYIKLFEVLEGTGGIHNPRSTLTPPHYDGIESLCIHSDSLFSASRDACIKKWDLSNQRLVHSVNQAHRDWIQSLAVLPNSNTLISGCRQGFLKLWSAETCSLLGDIKAHTQAINCIDTNAALVFTASGDNTIGLWTKRSTDSPDVSD